jgi:hypothetical protein
MKMEFVSEMLIDLNNLMQLSAWENYVKFCCHKSFRKYKMKCL